MGKRMSNGRFRKSDKSTMKVRNGKGRGTVDLNHYQGESKNRLPDEARLVDDIRSLSPPQYRKPIFRGNDRIDNPPSQADDVCFKSAEAARLNGVLEPSTNGHCQTATVVEVKIQEVDSDPGPELEPNQPEDIMATRTVLIVVDGENLICSCEELGYDKIDHHALMLATATQAAEIHTLLERPKYFLRRKPNCLFYDKLRESVDVIEITVDTGTLKDLVDRHMVEALKEMVEEYNPEMLICFSGDHAFYETLIDFVRKGIEVVVASVPQNSHPCYTNDPQIKYQDITELVKKIGIPKESRRKSRDTAELKLKIRGDIPIRVLRRLINLVEEVTEPYRVSVLHYEIDEVNQPNQSS